MPVNHLLAETHSGNVSIMVHHLRLREMRVIHSKIDHGCYMRFRMSRRIYCRLFWVIFHVYVSLKFSSVDIYLKSHIYETTKVCHLET